MCYHDTAAESTNNLPEALNDDHEYSDDAYFMHKEDVAPTPEQLQMEQALALELEQEAAVSNDDRIVGNDDDGSVYGSLFLYFTRSSTGGYIDDDDIMLPQPSLSMSEFADAEKEQLARKEGCNHHKHLRRALNNEPDPTTATSTDTASDTTYTPEGEYFLGYCTAPQPQQEDFNKELARYRYPGKRRLLVDEVPKLVFVWQSAPPPPPPLISGAALAAVLLLLLPLLTCVVLHTNKLLQRGEHSIIDAHLSCGFTIPLMCTGYILFLDDGKASSAITIV